MYGTFTQLVQPTVRNGSKADLRLFVEIGMRAQLAFS